MGGCDFFVCECDECVTFHDATTEIEAALTDPVMATKVAAVQAEMDQLDHNWRTA